MKEKWDIYFQNVREIQSVDSAEKCDKHRIVLHRVEIK